MAVSAPESREPTPVFDDAFSTVRPEPATRTLRVLHVINGEHFAGAERVQDLLAARLPDHGVQPAFACLKPGRFAAMRQTQGAPLVELPMRTRFDLRPAVRLAQLVRIEGYDILHTHSARALLIARLASRQCAIPIVHHVHGNTASEMAGRRFSRINAWVERGALRHVAAVVAVSESVGDYLQTNGIARERLHVVPNGVPARAELNHKPLQPQHWTIGFVALLRPRKGLETLLEAASLARVHNPSLRLRIVGRFETSEYERDIMDYANKLNLSDIIEWRGFRQRVDTELDAMDILAFPSILPEGMPMVLLEAMAAGVPIVASRVSGVVDLLRDGEDSLLMPPADAAALSEALNSLVADDALRNRLRTTAFIRQRKCFSDDTMSAAVAKIYRNILVG
jgi:phosphatidyl-myo-inositol alpha-mannosyltransferase